MMTLLHARRQPNSIQSRAIPFVTRSRRGGWVTPRGPRAALSLGLRGEGAVQ